MALAAVTLDDKYVLEQGRVYLTGVQALAVLEHADAVVQAMRAIGRAGFLDVESLEGGRLGGAGA